LFGNWVLTLTKIWEDIFILYELNLFNVLRYFNI